MCKVCDNISKKFPLDASNHSSAFNDYIWAYKTLRQKVQKGYIEFLAGDCPLNDIEKHIDVEDLYTMYHYFKCKCNKIFFVGFCCRGMPLGKIISKLPDNIAEISNGHFGTYYEKKYSL